MPLILAQNEMSESGISYIDNTGVSYEFPPMYKNLIRPGERFIYYRGRKTLSSSRTPQIYFGCGVIGDVEPGIIETSRWRCEILDYRPFERAIPFKKGETGYLETGGTRRGYFQKGVRRVSEAEFDGILRNGITSSLPSSKTESSASGGYASREMRFKIETFAVESALRELAIDFPQSSSSVMPKNNPGFDILLSNSDIRFVEVKGTLSALPGFFITSGEMKFSTENLASYLLLIIYAINFEEGTYKAYSYKGDISRSPFLITPTQFRAVLPTLTSL
jgi:hypothetical protein